MPAGGSLVQASENVGVWLGLSQHPPLHPLLCVPPPGPLGPCLRPTHPGLLSQRLSGHASITPTPWGDPESHGETSQRKRVVFADAKGLPLTAVRILSELEERPGTPRPTRLPELGGETDGSSGCPVGTPGRRPRWRLVPPPPSNAAQVFCSLPREEMVLLENCSVSASAFHGTVRVRNVSYQKDVRVRVTFDSWLSHQDVPCVYLRQLYGKHETDIFEFSVALPDVLDEREKVEFCVSYLPGGYSTAFWDNNHEQNYRLLCQ